MNYSYLGRCWLSLLEEGEEVFYNLETGGEREGGREEGGRGRRRERGREGGRGRG